MNKFVYIGLWIALTAGAARSEAASPLKPCADRPGSTHSDKGSGNCRGNLTNRVGAVSNHTVSQPRPTVAFSESNLPFNEALYECIKGLEKGSFLYNDKKHIARFAPNTVLISSNDGTINYLGPSGNYHVTMANLESGSVVSLPDGKEYFLVAGTDKRPVLIRHPTRSELLSQISSLRKSLQTDIEETENRLLKANSETVQQDLSAYRYAAQETDHWIEKIKNPGTKEKSTEEKEPKWNEMKHLLRMLNEQPVHSRRLPELLVWLQNRYTDWVSEEHLVKSEKVIDVKSLPKAQAEFSSRQEIEQLVSGKFKKLQANWDFSLSADSRHLMIPQSSQEGPSAQSKYEEGIRSFLFDVQNSAYSLAKCAQLISKREEKTALLKFASDASNTSFQTIYFGKKYPALPIPNFNVK